VLLADASNSPTPVTPIVLKDDTYSQQISPGPTLFFSNMRVLENDTPDTLSLIGVEPIDSAKGTVEVEASKRLLVYKLLDTTGLARGTTFTDRYRCAYLRKHGRQTLL
jgi:hypothetical protein